MTPAPADPARSTRSAVDAQADLTSTVSRSVRPSDEVVGPPLGPLPWRVAHWGVDAIYGALTLALTPYALTRVLVDHKTRARWRAYAQDLPERFSGRRKRKGTAPCVWVHGVSVGEVKAVARLVEAMEDEVAGLETVITVSTDTARRVAQARYEGRRIDFYPPDFSWIVDNALDAIRPDLVVLAESEFWPNFLLACRERAIPVVLVNGKISERSSGRFGGVGGPARLILGALEEICVQIELYAERFRGVGLDPARIHVTGNMKFDNIPMPIEDPRQRAFDAVVGHDGSMPLVVAGSTHPGEERALARIRQRLAAAGQPFRLLVAPRHPARGDVVEAELKREGLSVVRRSRVAQGQPANGADVVLLDTVGELEMAYALADIVFVGGTLVPHGGQNMMEPASLGRPVVVGPSLFNFRGEVDLLRHADGLEIVDDEAGVEATLSRWFRDPQAAAAVGRRAFEAIRASKGATDKTMEVLRPLLGRIATARSQG